MVKRKDAEEGKIDRLRKQYRDHLSETGKGIFTQRLRQQLVGEKPKYENTFWYRIRNDVRLSLIDLGLFIETAGENNVNQVVTAKTLESIVYPLLWNPVVDGDKPNRNRAEIAGLFIKVGLGYLRQKSGHFLSERLINDALELTELLVGNFQGAEDS